MKPDTIAELIMWLGAVGAVALLVGALIIGPAIYRWRLRRTFRRIQDVADQQGVELPELCELLAQVPPRPGDYRWRDNPPGYSQAPAPSAAWWET